MYCNLLTEKQNPVNRPQLLAKQYMYSVKAVFSREWLRHYYTSLNMAGQPWLWLQTASVLLAVSLASARCIRLPCNNSNKLVCTDKTDTCTDGSSQEHLIACIFDQNSKMTSRNFPSQHKMGEWVSMVNWGDGHVCTHAHYIHMNTHTIVVQTRWTTRTVMNIHSVVNYMLFLSVL